MFFLSSFLPYCSSKFETLNKIPFPKMREAVKLELTFHSPIDKNFFIHQSSYSWKKYFLYLYNWRVLHKFTNRQRTIQHNLGSVPFSTKVREIQYPFHQFPVTQCWLLSSFKALIKNCVHLVTLQLFVIPIQKYQ